MKKSSYLFWQKLVISAIVHTRARRHIKAGNKSATLDNEQPSEDLENANQRFFTLAKPTWIGVPNSNVCT